MKPMRVRCKAHEGSSKDPAHNDDYQDVRGSAKAWSRKDPLVQEYHGQLDSPFRKVGQDHGSVKMLRYGYQHVRLFILVGRQTS